MEFIRQLLSGFDLDKLVIILIALLACIVCITVHELCHGLAAWALGDCTAKRTGRLSLNPLAHIDPIGFLMLLIARVGWAKPVPVDVRSFRHPKRDMALTALAGPVSNFLVAFLCVCSASVIYPFANGVAWAYVLYFLCYTCVLSVGLGLFNLIPIPPLDGSKLLFFVFPDKLYFAYLRYERYLMLLVVALVWFGFLSGPLSAAIGWVISGFCRVIGFPFDFFTYCFAM